MQYAQLTSNFSSAYNVPPPAPIYHRPIPISAPIYTDLYHSDDYSVSPTSSIVVHHHHPLSPSPPAPILSQTVSKLRQINDELSQTLAQCDLSIRSSPSPSATAFQPVHSHHLVHHRHHHHRPITPRSPSVSDNEDFLLDDSEPIDKRHRAKVNYKIRIPRRSRSQLDEILVSTSDVYSHDDPMTVDVYPTRGNGFVRHIRDRPDNQKPWLDDLRLSSPTPRGPYYNNNQPLTPPSRLVDRPRSATPKTRPVRVRRDSAPNPLRHSLGTFANTPPVWRPGGTIKRPKFIGSNAPSSPTRTRHEPAWHPGGVAKKTKTIRAFDPTTKSSETKKSESVVAWKPSSKSIERKVTKYFEPTPKEEFKKDKPPVPPKRIEKKTKRITSADPQLKSRISQAQSKVQTRWDQPPVARPRAPIVKPPPPPPPPTAAAPRPVRPASRPRAPVPASPIKKKTSPTVQPIDVDTGRSSFAGMPTNPIHQSTPLDRSLINGVSGGDAGGVQDFFNNNESEIESPVAPPPGPPSAPVRSQPITPSKSPANIHEETPAPSVRSHSPPPANINRDDESQNTEQDVDEPSKKDDDTVVPLSPKPESEHDFEPEPVFDESIHSADENHDDQGDEGEEEENKSVHSPFPSPPRRPASPPAESTAKNDDEEADSFFQ